MFEAPCIAAHYNVLHLSRLKADLSSVECTLKLSNHRTYILVCVATYMPQNVRP